MFGKSITCRILQCIWGKLMMAVLCTAKFHDFGQSTKGLIRILNRLECYQCTPDYPAPQMCDDYHWHTLVNLKKDELIVGCPGEISAFCIKIEVSDGKQVNSFRGCIGNHDARGNKIMEGCIENKRENQTVRFCFCKDRLCNSGNKNYKCFLVFLMFSVVYYIF